MGEEKILDKIGFFKPRKELIVPLSVAGLVLVGITTFYTINAGKKESAQLAAPATQTLPLKAVTALGRIEPQGELIKLSPSPDLGGNKITELLVKEGDRLLAGQIIAVLDNHDPLAAEVELARQEVKVAQADLEIIKAGAKKGDIQAQEATISRWQAELQGKIASNDAEIARLRAQLRTETAERQAIIERSQAELRNAESEFRRYEKLAEEGVISDSDLDSRRLTLDTAQKSLAEAQASYNKSLDTIEEQIKQAQAIATQDRSTLKQQISEAEATLNSVAEVRDVDVIKAQAQVDKAIAALKKAQEDLEQTSVKAPTDGQIIKINAYPGELINQDDGLVEFGQTDRMIVVAEVYESDINRVKTGQTVTITSETGAFTGKITGKVAQIGLKIGKQEVLDTDPAADVDSRVVEVKILLDKESSDRVSALTNSKVITKINLSY